MTSKMKDRNSVITLLLCTAFLLFAGKIVAAVGLENTSTPVDFGTANPTIALTTTSADIVIVQVMTKGGTAATNVSDQCECSHTLTDAWDSAAPFGDR